jgi:hypothetical protein
MNGSFDNVATDNLDVRGKVKVSSGEVFLGNNGNRTTIASNSPSSDITLTLPTATGSLLGSGGRVLETLTAADLDTQSGTLTAAQILGGILVHTSTTGGGTLTTDTAANIISNCGLSADNMCISCYVINDGDKTVTLAGGSNVTFADTGQTIDENESAKIIFRRTSSTAVTAYIVGA